MAKWDGGGGSVKDGGPPVHAAGTKKWLPRQPTGRRASRLEAVSHSMGHSMGAGSAAPCPSHAPHRCCWAPGRWLHASGCAGSSPLAGMLCYCLQMLQTAFVFLGGPRAAFKSSMFEVCLKPAPAPALQYTHRGHMGCALLQCRLKLPQGLAVSR